MLLSLFGIIYQWRWLKLIGRIKIKKMMISGSVGVTVMYSRVVGGDSLLKECVT